MTFLVIDVAALLAPTSLWWIPPVVLVLDRFFIYPVGLPHPVQGIGRLANWVEPFARKARHTIFAGGAALAFLLLLTTVGIFLFVSLGFSLAPVCGWLTILSLSWSGLALGNLVRAGEKALASIVTAEQNAHVLPEARLAVQMLVSRDTSQMDCANLYRSLAESLSENLNDALVAPFFWLVVGGPLGLWLYKTVSTMDSMWGYKTEKWLLLGRVSARLDDVLAYIPARLTAFFLMLSTWSYGYPFSVRTLFSKKKYGSVSRQSFFSIWRTIRRQAGLMESPNSGWPMAAAALLHDGKMGGPTIYDGKIVNKPILGLNDGQWGEENIQDLITHIVYAGVFGCLLFWCFWCIVI